MTRCCETCRYACEDGGPGEGCGAYLVCTRLRPWRQTEPGQTCPDYEPPAWAGNGGRALKRKQITN